MYTKWSIAIGQRGMSRDTASIILSSGVLTLLMSLSIQLGRKAKGKSRHRKAT